MKTICLYHRSDLDGHCSGAIVKKFVPDAELIGIDYGDEVPWDKIDGARVYLVDFSLQPWDRMQMLRRKASMLIWIDHHRSAINLYESESLGDGNSTVTAFLEEKKAACELCWEFFTMEPMPLPVRLLGRYDVWDLSFTPDVLPFQMGMRLNDTDPSGDYDWGIMFIDSVRTQNWIRFTCDRGRTILEYQRQQNARLMGVSFVREWKGLKFLAVNTGGVNSQAFESKYDPLLHDAVMAFHYNGRNGSWTFSLYSPDQSIDLCGLAKRMGGGGHPAACGFQIFDGPTLKVVLGDVMP